jgi:flagellar biosynthesis protein FliQ
MTFGDAIGLGREALFVAIVTAAPVLLLSMIVGLVVSIFQSVTQVQEPTLAFIPKILVAGLGVLFFGPFMLAMMTNFTSTVFSNLPYFVK